MTRPPVERETDGLHPPTAALASHSVSISEARYRTLVQSAGLTDRVSLPEAPSDRRHIFNQYVIRIPGRDRVRQTLDDRGIGTEIYYPVPFHLQECFASLGHRPGEFPEAEAAANTCLALPIYSELTLEQQSAVVNALSDALRN